MGQSGRQYRPVRIPIEVKPSIIFAIKILVDDRPQLTWAAYTLVLGRQLMTSAVQEFFLVSKCYYKC